MKRAVYAVLFVLLLAMEVGIGLWVHDGFIRPYVGDVLVTVLLCCLVRCAFPNGPKLLALYVFLFAAAVELVQLLQLANRFGIKNRILRIALGTTFDWSDILCYAAGCALFYAAERLFRRKRGDAGA